MVVMGRVLLITMLVAGLCLLVAMTRPGSASTACKADEDCSLNGICDTASGSCSCNAAWGGTACSQLRLLPAAKDAGLHSLVEGQNVSSWGGSVVELDGEWHMYASQMINHCGIDSWVYNSRIVHATSTTAGGKYEVRDTVFPVFSHEPNVVRIPEGARGTDGAQLAMFFTASSAARTHCNCTDGTTDGGEECAGDSPSDEGGTYLSWAVSGDGPWSEPLLLYMVGDSDTNLAPIIFDDGSLVGMWRTFSFPGGSEPKFVTASDWRDPITYTFETEPLFSGLGGIGIEDPTVYQDARGNFHALFHNMGCLNFWTMCPHASGVHAFSRDGRNWTYGGVAYNATPVHFDDGTSLDFKRHERPHVVVDTSGAITHLITGAEYGGKNGDGTYTLIQPVCTTALCPEVPQTPVVSIV